MNPCPDDMPAQSSGWDAAAVVWLVIIVSVVIFEVWALSTGRPTLSQWLQKWSGRLAWVRWVGIGALIFAGWHWFR